MAWLGRYQSVLRHRRAGQVERLPEAQTLLGRAKGPDRWQALCSEGSSELVPYNRSNHTRTRSPAEAADTRHQGQRSYRLRRWAALSAPQSVLHHVAGVGPARVTSGSFVFCHTPLHRNLLHENAWRVSAISGSISTTASPAAVGDSSAKYTSRTDLGRHRDGCCNVRQSHLRAICDEQGRDIGADRCLGRKQEWHWI